MSYSFKRNKNQANMKLISLFLCMINCTFGLKLEKWHHPDIEGSIQPEALSTALRNPKIFFGVSGMLEKFTSILKS